MAKTFTAPPRPEIKFGVWNMNYFREALPGDARGRIVIGYAIYPWTYYGFMHRPTREELEPYLPREVGSWQRSFRSLMVNQISLPEALEGKTITRIEPRAYGEVWFHLECGGVIKSSSRRSSWYTPRILPEREGPWVVKKMLKTTKIIRCDDKTSVNIELRGNLKLDDITSPLLETYYEGA